MLQFAHTALALSFSISMKAQHIGHNEPLTHNPMSGSPAPYPLDFNVLCVFSFSCWIACVWPWEVELQRHSSLTESQQVGRVAISSNKTTVWNKEQGSY